jgi:hypothetical protein
VKVQAVEAQLSDSDSSAGNKPDKSPPHKQKIIKKKYSEVTIEKCYKGHNLLPSFFHCKQGNQLTCNVKTKCFQFVKIESQ